MKNIFPEKFNEIDYHLPADFDELIEEHPVYTSLSQKADFLVDKHTSEYEKKLHYYAIKIIATALIPQQEGRSSGISVIREQILDLYDKLSMEELNVLSTYYGLSKSLKEDHTQQFFLTEIDGEKIHHSTIKKIIVNAFLFDVEMQLEKIKMVFKYQVSRDFWYPMFEVEHEGEGEKTRIDYLVESVL